MRIKAASAVVIVALTILMGASLARADGGFEITWYTVDGGGATFSAGDGYTLGGTIGQPDAGGPQTADGYTLQGGFWAQRSRVRRRPRPSRCPASRAGVSGRSRGCS